jgi:hypothetical protein
MARGFSAWFVNLLDLLEGHDNVRNLGSLAGPDQLRFMRLEGCDPYGWIALDYKARS